MIKIIETICGTMICIFCTPLGWCGMLIFAMCISTIIEEKNSKKR